MITVKKLNKKVIMKLNINNFSFNHIINIFNDVNK